MSGKIRVRKVVRFESFGLAIQPAKEIEAAKKKKQFVSSRRLYGVEGEDLPDMTEKEMIASDPEYFKKEDFVYEIKTVCRGIASVNDSVFFICGDEPVVRSFDANTGCSLANAVIPDKQIPLNICSNSTTLFALVGKNNPAVYLFNHKREHIKTIRLKAERAHDHYLIACNDNKSFSVYCKVSQVITKISISLGIVISTTPVPITRGKLPGKLMIDGQGNYVISYVYSEDISFVKESGSVKHVVSLPRIKDYPIFPVQSFEIVDDHHLAITCLRSDRVMIYNHSGDTPVFVNNFGHKFEKLHLTSNGKYVGFSTSKHKFFVFNDIQKVLQASA